ncbi:MAG: NAD(P)-binding protein [Deltaproteobacteria bacterium]|nr:NAD(P)-binding protein [Deltaproteobacteria bacterium]
MSKAQAIKFERVSDVPDSVVSQADMSWNHTGSWRYLKPSYENKTPPCNHGCPAGNDVEGLLALIGQERPDEAWRLLVEENPFPSVCGRVCFHPCETACNRGGFDRPVAINAMERFAAEHAAPDEVPRPLREPSGKRVHILGAGPSGLSAAYHLARLGHDVVVFESAEEAGGLLRYGIPNYRLPREILAREIERVERLGVLIHTNTRVGTDLSLEQAGDADALFVACGAHRSMRLGMPGEDLDNVWTGLEFLRRVAAGNPPSVGERVAVIGDGNTAIDAARTARRLGAEVCIYSLLPVREMAAHEEEIAEALKEGVAIETHCLASEFSAASTGRLVLRFDRVKLGPRDEFGWPHPERLPETAFTAQASQVVVAIGQNVDFSFLPDALHGPRGRVGLDRPVTVGRARLFAGGDCASNENTVAHAIGAGKKAALRIDAYLDGGSDEIPARSFIGATGAVSINRYLVSGKAHRRAKSSNGVVSFDKINTNYFTEASRPAIRQEAVRERLADFREVEQTITYEQATAEASRCFHCGVCTMCDTCLIFCPDLAITRRSNGSAGYTIDFDYCKGCGVCVHECPRNAMSIAEE